MGVRIKWIKSWRELPLKVREPGMVAYHNPRTGTIYAVRGVATRADLEHEKYHGIKRHPDHPRSPLRYVANELSATYYGYKKVGRPHHILGELGGIYYILRLEYGLNKRQAIATIKRVVARLSGIPKSWLADVKKLEVKALGGKG